MQVIYRMQEGRYPFHHQKQSDRAYVEFLKTTQSQVQVDQLREFGRNFRAITCAHLIRLIKILRQENEMHFLYEYCDTSIQSHIAQHPQSELKKLLGQLTCALQCLCQAGFKTDLHLCDLGVDQNGNLKLFVSPNCETNVDHDELLEFYCTERTRLRFQMEDIWERHEQEKPKEGTKTQKQPNFFISGNQLIFLKNGHAKHEEENTAASYKDSTQGPSELARSKKDVVTNANLAKNIIQEIEKQKERTQLLKNKRPNSKLDADEVCAGKLGKYASPNSKDKDTPISEKHTFKLFSKDSIDSENNQNRRESHRNSTGCPNILHHLKKTQDRLGNSANIKNQEKYRGTGDFMLNKDDRPNSNLKLQGRDSMKYNQLLTPQSQNRISLPTDYQPEEGDRIQVTTQMVSKYKMKIVTCQEIEFEGKQGDDIEQLAHDKLVEYQSQHGLPQLMFENNSSRDNRDSIDRSGDNSEERTQMRQYVKTWPEHKNSNEQIMNKILMAKQKASTALKQYKNRKK